MPAQEKIARLKQMLRQVAADDGLETLHETSASRFVPEGTDRTDHAANALEKLAADRDQELIDKEVFALEAIILPDTRPVILVQNGTYGNLGDPWTTLNAPKIRSRITPLLPSVGRIELPTNPQYPYGGTGFVVGTELLLTNRHVARLFSSGLGLTIQYRAGDAAVDFRQEYGQSAGQSMPLRVVAVEMIHPFWDMAILRVHGLEGRIPPLPLSVADPHDLEGEDVVVIGYPARDDRNDLNVQDRVFNRIYNVKRLQPGKLRRRALIQSFENQVSAVTHDSSTLGGNSGSAVIGVKSGKVVGLHFAGEYLKANYAVPAYELARDSRVVKFGLNFDGSLPSTTEFDAAWHSVSGVEAGPSAGGGGVLSLSSWTIPIRVEVSLGAPAQATSASGSMPLGTPASGSESLKQPLIVGNLAGRKGYQSGFLGLPRGAEVPLPVLTKRGKTAVARQDNGETELKYHKFSIVMHEKRRLALFTAANVDWRAEKRLIKGRKPSRKQLTGLGDGDIEKWAIDERLPVEVQLPDVFYTKDGGAFDKGHLVRRDDVVWGDGFKDMQKANGDTYHTTNCSPQVKSFNQSAQGENNWGDLEKLVQDQTRTEKAIIFSGPVFGDDDRVFVGRDDAREEIHLKIPRKFWKIIVVREKSDVGAYGFVLEQDLSRVKTVEEFAVPPEWRQYTSSIADIEGLLGGLVELKWLKKRDRFGSEESVAIQKALE